MNRREKFSRQYGAIFPRPTYIQRGAGVLPIYRGPLIQRGYGIGAILSGLLRLIKPVLRKGIKTLTKSGKEFIKSDVARKLGKKGGQMLKESGERVVKDVIKGVPVKESLKKELRTQKKKIKGQLKKTGGKIIADVVKGEPVKESIIKEVKESMKKAPVKRKNIKKPMVNMNFKKQKRDIFS